MHDYSVWWTITTIGGPILLILIFGYILFTRRRLSAGEREAQRHGTERLYRDGPK